MVLQINKGGETLPYEGDPNIALIWSLVNLMRTLNQDFIFQQNSIKMLCEGPC